MPSVASGRPWADWAASLLSEERPSEERPSDERSVGHPRMNDQPRILSIAGLDPCGGAGLLADARAITACGGMALGVLACTTVQNRHGLVSATPAAVADLRAALDAVRGDGPLHAVKTGLLLDPAVVAVVAAWLGEFEERPPLVVDPVLSITAGGGDAAGIARWARALRDELVPLGAILTPNQPELDLLVRGGDPRALLREGATAVLITGGHGHDSDHAVDVLHDGGGVVDFRRPLLQRGPVHGTGCALSAALATCLGHGLDLRAAVNAAGDDVAAWLRLTPDDGSGLPEPLAIGVDR